MVDEGEPKLKPAGITFDEARRLREYYRYTLENWQENRVNYGLPMELDKSFVLVIWGRPGYADFHFDYLSNFGFIRLNMYIVDKNNKIIIVNEDMYTLGPYGRTRGKGKQGMDGVHRILQSISDATGYTIYDVATPNQKSLHLLSDSEGYNVFSNEERSRISRTFDVNYLSKWERLMNSVKQHYSLIKEYCPLQTPLSLSERENKEIEIILNTIAIERPKRITESKPA